MFSKNTWHKTNSKTSKDLYHTTRSNQNSWYVMNKNIAPSKIAMVVRRKRGCHSGASPSLVASFSLDNDLGCHGASPSLGSSYSLFLHPSWSHPKLENFNHTKLNQTFVRTVSITKQITTLSTVANPFIFYFCIISTIFQLYRGLYPPIKTIDSSK